MNRLFFWVTLGAFAIAAVLEARGHWGNLARHALLHGYVMAWLLVLTFATRTVGVREVLRFWFTGYFAVAFLVYVVGHALEHILPMGNFQTAVLVPGIEETFKALPLGLWLLLQRPRGYHPTVSDLMVLGFATGAGFAFHEDLLWGRVAATGFGGSLWGRFFPTFFHGSLFVVTHSGWTLLVGVGLGAAYLYRSRRFGRFLVIAPLLLAYLDHAAVNWRGRFARTLGASLLHGHLAGYAVVVCVIAVPIHDWLMLRWASKRDHAFPPPSPLRELSLLVPRGEAVKGGSLEVWGERLRRFFTAVRYRRLRAAVFTDLYRVRSQGRPAGDRGQVIATLTAWRAAAVRLLPPPPAPVRTAAGPSPLPRGEAA